jgi:hypothetical protein
MEMVHEFRDISPWVAEGYILSLPGSVRESKGFSGPGWRISIEELPDVDVGSLRFRQIRLTLSGAHDVVEQVWEQLGPNFYRGGA